MIKIPTVSRVPHDSVQSFLDCWLSIVAYKFVQYTPILKKHTQNWGQEGDRSAPLLVKYKVWDIYNAHLINGTFREIRVAHATAEDLNLSNIRNGEAKKVRVVE